MSMFIFRFFKIIKIKFKISFLISKIEVFKMNKDIFNICSSWSNISKHLLKFLSKIVENTLIIIF